jgi:hypothetical protein
LAARYGYQEDDDALKAGRKIRIGDYSRENLMVIVKWKSKRSTQAVRRVLWSPKYKGTVAYGMTTQKLKTPRVKIAPDQWVTCDCAWEPIVDTETFERASRRFHLSPRFKSDEQLLDELRNLWRLKGRLSHNLVTPANGISSLDIYRTRFGSFTKALLLIGHTTHRGPRVEARQEIAGLRNGLISEIVASSDGKVSVVRRSLHFRARLKLKNRLLVSVYLCRHTLIAGKKRWILDNHSEEHSRVNLIARLTPDNHAFKTSI